MNIERGLRRIAIVLSFALLGIGAAFDALWMLPHATVRVTVKDGREFTVQRHTPAEFSTSRDSLTRVLISGGGVYEGTSKEFLARTGAALNSQLPLTPPPDYWENVDASSLESVKIIRGPSYRWWSDADWTKGAFVLVILLWLLFYALRWIVRGFTGA